MSEPRYLVIAMRSYTGSQTALLNAAIDLLEGSGELLPGGGGSEYELYELNGQEFLAATILLRSSAPVPRILEVMHNVEAQLADTSPNPQLPTMKLDLLWVEGIEVHSPEVTLPNPLLVKEKWANSTFVEAAEMAIVKSVEQGTQNKEVLKPIEHAYKHFQATDSDWDKWSLPLGGYDAPSLTRTASGTTYTHAGINELDGLSVATSLVVFAQIDHDYHLSHPDEDDEDTIKGISNISEHIESNTLMRINTPTGTSSSYEHQIRTWLEAVRKTSIEHNIQLKYAVIFGRGADQIRGAIIGHLKKGLMIMLPPLDSLEITFKTYPPHPQPATEISLNFRSF